ncbi:MAG: cytochrome c oxidase subunit 3 [Simkaniaceae bacterium]|nr:cytochrome c oxidase subunit 3 [Simkaniaceae bacterium]
MTHRVATPDPHHGAFSKTVFGFWLYLLSDFMLFATIFAAYAVLKNSTFGSVSTYDLLNLPSALLRTLVFLFSTYTIGIAGAYAHRNNKRMTVLFFLVTFVLGILFLWMQQIEFAGYIKEGHTWQGSAFLSMFYTLVGTHSLHLMFGLVWIVIFMIPVVREGITSRSLKRLTCLKMFWQFLNIIWVFIFTFVYLMGVIQ